MLFNSLDFLFFFPIVISIYFIIPLKARKIWLVIASYFFYMSWNAVYALLIGASTLITYFSGLAISRFSEDNQEKERHKKKIVLIISVSLNLGILFVFKYSEFLIESINAVLKIIHVTSLDYRLKLLLPVGISFYTFQALGYVVDVYKGEIEAENNLLNYVLFVSFFPQLVAGPIERSKNLLYQIENITSIKLFNAKRVTSGAILMVWGYFMKMVIADRASLLVDMVFDNYRMYGSTELILAAIGFSLQIYCDFSSYSLIAIGSAKILGFSLMENFNTPYFAKDIREFWGRWHISLSSWFRDYMYIPLGGNRRGKIRKAINIMCVFIVSGLWHGANWNYIAWGGIHGAYQVLEDVIFVKCQAIYARLKIKTECMSWKLAQILKTFGLVTLAWVFFRSDSVIDAIRYIKRIIVKPNPWTLFNGGIYELGLDRVEMNILMFSVVVLLMVDFIKYFRKQTIDEFLFEQNIWFEWVTIIGLVVMIFMFGEYGATFDAQQFIYFQF